MDGNSITNPRADLQRRRGGASHRNQQAEHISCRQARGAGGPSGQRLVPWNALRAFRVGRLEEVNPHAGKHKRKPTPRYDRQKLLDSVFPIYLAPEFVYDFTIGLVAALVVIMLFAVSGTLDWRMP